MTTKYQTITTHQQDSDETIAVPKSLLIDTKVYEEKLAMEKVEREVKQITSYLSYLSDVMACLDVIKNKETKELTIIVTADKYGDPKLIRKRYTVSKKDYPRR